MHCGADETSNLLARERNVVYTTITQNITYQHKPTILHAALDALFFSKKHKYKVLILRKKR